MSTAPRLVAGSVIGGKYRLEAPVARGGMGAVWRAQHIALGVRVAVKFMDAAYASSPTLRARFATEAKAAAGLSNRHIVDVRDYGVDGDTPYLVMELLRGEDLGARLHRERRISLAATAALVSQVARGLRGAHDAGLIHRDLKPGNIFLAVAEDEETVKVLDFGIAKDSAARFGGETTATGDMMGSPQYMSPEQVRGARDLDPRSDVWAIGVIVFRCLTGRLPFDADVVGAVIGQILADPIPIATRLAPDLPPAIDAFFARALARDRAARFGSVRELSAALSALAGAPMEATSGAFPRLAQASLSTLEATPGPAPLDEVKTLVMTPGTGASGSLAGAIAPPARLARTAWAGAAVVVVLLLVTLGVLVALRAPPSIADLPAAPERAPGVAPTASTPNASASHDAPVVTAATAPTASASASAAPSAPSSRPSGARRAPPPPSAAPPRSSPDPQQPARPALPPSGLD